MKSLTAILYINLDVIERNLIELTEEGEGYAKDGCPEFQFVSNIKMGEVVDNIIMESRVGKKIT